MAGTINETEKMQGPVTGEERKAMRQYHERGLSERRIATLTGRSRWTVHTTLTTPEPTEPSFFKRFLNRLHGR